MSQEWEQTHGAHQFASGHGTLADEKGSGEMTGEQKVRAIHKHAQAMESLGGKWIILKTQATMAIVSPTGSLCIGVGDTEAEAWADAASHLAPADAPQEAGAEAKVNFMQTVPGSFRLPGRDQSQPQTAEEAAEELKWFGTAAPVASSGTATGAFQVDIKDHHFVDGLEASPHHCRFCGLARKYHTAPPQPADSAPSPDFASWWATKHVTHKNDGVAHAAALAGWNARGGEVARLERELAEVKQDRDAFIEREIAVGGDGEDAQTFEQVIEGLRGLEPFWSKAFNDERIAHEATQSARDQAQASADAMRKALRQAADQFRWYSKLHAQKVPPDTGKAEANAAMADICEAALSPTSDGAATDGGAE